MDIDIICMGKLKETYWREAEKEYLKRLKRFAKVSIIEILEENAGPNLSKKEIERLLSIEGEKILSRIRGDSYVVSLAINGKTFDSPGFAKFMDGLAVHGRSCITFIIGSSYGLADTVLSKSDMLLSFGSFTYPHQLMRIILLEQIYRAYKINAGEPYHR
ncbi:MAG: 23S rRNA (pseudouridine(1915)-N(3))-methyltransferase RlmH [Thermoanaerobacteraceae bacterium]|nr:23S rRNA (pseudouridine(1915)-N(3))-methyltransferase RlmH [Thermoanaerobacteraceae bacterium]